MAYNLSPLRVSQSYHDHEGNQVVEFSPRVTGEDGESVELSPLVTGEDDEIVELSPRVTEEDDKSVELIPPVLKPDEGVELSPPVLKPDEVRKFRELVMKGEWVEVIDKYYDNINYHKIRIKGRGTAFHVAVISGLKYAVESLLNAIEKDDDKRSSLKIKNERGATPLHYAAYRGFTNLCELIIGKNGERKDLIQEKDDDGETPLYWAVCAHKSLVFLYLQQFYPCDLGIALDKNNTSILHLTIQRDMFDLAIIIMHCYKDLIDFKDKDGNVPLEILATRTSAFESESRLPWWKKFLYYCVPISQDDEKTIFELYQKKAKDKEKENKGEGCPSQENSDRIHYVDKLENDYKIQPSKKNVLCDQKINKYCDLFGLEEIKTIKMKHLYGGLLFREFIENHLDPYDGDGALDFPDYTEYRQKKGDIIIQDPNENIKIEDSKNIDGKDTTFPTIVKCGFEDIMEGLNSKVPITSDKKGLLLVAMNYIKTEVKNDVRDTSYLIAASYGINEMMEELESRIPSVIFDTNSNRENSLLLAVKNRQPHVIQRLKKYYSGDIFDHLNLQLDKNQNTMLHLAAFTSFQRENTWMISGVALQMMWDIKWYKYIKGIVPEHFSNSSNKHGHTPSEIFKDHHKELLQNSAGWLKDTAESCSVVAALIAGVSFATSGSVPGGNQQSGEPTLEGKPAFEGFAISSLIGLYFSVTALIMFLAILTSRKEIEDFRIKLPMKLLLGLSSLFVSIVSMFVSFCAGHFFVLTDKYTKGCILFYLYISICVPVAFYAAVQFPLFLDLVKVICNKVPPRSIKGVLL